MSKTMYFRTGRACLLAFYEGAASEIAVLFNREVPKLETVGWRALEIDRSRWTTHIDGTAWVDICYGAYDLPFTMVIFDSHDSHLRWLETLFRALLTWSIKPREVLVADAEKYSVDLEMLTSFQQPATADDYLDPVEGNHSAWGTHSVRAFRKDSLVDPQSWALAARERGFKWTETDHFFVLDVHWDQKLEAPPHLDPFSLALNEGYLIEEFSDLLEGTQGTAFLVLLSRTDLNPDRSHQKWREILPPIAKALSDHCGPDGLVGRYYGFLNLLVVRPTIPKSEAQAERQNLLNLLRQHGTENSRIEVISWPEDLSDNPNESIFDTLLDLTYSDSPEYSS